jgi:coenzyme F420 hydrogenase subunit beta
VSARVSMDLSPDGFMRPVLGPDSPDDRGVRGRDEARGFNAMCPGVRLSAPSPNNSRHHEIFGAYFSAWEAVAVDEQVRHSGSSGGVLTALTTWLVETGQVDTMTGVSASVRSPRSTVPVTITSREEALAAAGSRYAPVSTLTGWTDQPRAGLVGKPCEVSAAVQHHNSKSNSAEMPISLSFFCAGTPSQHATDNLVESLGLDPATVSEVRYRGDGWPGRFRVSSTSGETASLTYQESWGKHLGRQLQWRCKTCVDGTGAHADISVGDLWESDASGYPVFLDSGGNSVAIARTERGHAIILAAAAAGVIAASPIELDRAARIQPLQVQRRETMLGRLSGRVLAGKTVPRYRGYGMTQIALRNIPGNFKGLIGTFLRTLGWR